MIKYKILIFSICFLSGCLKKSTGEVTFKSCSGQVVMDYDFLFTGAYDMEIGPEGHLSIEIYNDTNTDTSFYPKYDSRGLNSDENSSFELVVDKDTMQLSADRFKIGKGGYGNNYSLILYYREIKEDNKSDFVTDSTYYKNKLIRCLEKGEVIFTDYRSKKTAHVPKSPDFKIITNWQSFPDSLLK